MKPESYLMRSVINDSNRIVRNPSIQKLANTNLVTSMQSTDTKNSLQRQSAQINNVARTEKSADYMPSPKMGGKSTDAGSLIKDPFEELFLHEEALREARQESKQTQIKNQKL